MNISFQSGGKGVFPSTLVITSWKPPSAFLMCLRSQRDLKAKRAPGLWKGWEQSSPIEHKLNTSFGLTTGANDLPIASLMRLAYKKEDISQHHNKKHRREKPSVLTKWKMAK